MTFGSGKKLTICTHQHCIQYSWKKSIALPFFHSFTGCDTTSGFYGKGKKTAWEAWKSFPDVTLAFLHFQNNDFAQFSVESNYFKLLERFCVVMYDKTSSQDYSVIEARREMFCQKNRTMETIPPAQDDLIHDTRRAAYQSAIWTTSDRVNQDILSPEGYVWTMDKNSNSWLPVWTMIPVASKGISQMWM